MPASKVHRAKKRCVFGVLSSSTNRIPTFPGQRRRKSTAIGSRAARSKVFPQHSLPGAKSRVPAPPSTPLLRSRRRSHFYHSQGFTSCSYASRERKCGPNHSTSEVLCISFLTGDRNGVHVEEQHHPRTAGVPEAEPFLRGACQDATKRADGGWVRPGFRSYCRNWKQNVRCVSNKKKSFNLCERTKKPNNLDALASVQPSVGLGEGRLFGCPVASRAVHRRPQ